MGFGKNLQRTNLVLWVQLIHLRFQSLPETKIPYRLDGFDKIILLEYLHPPYSLFCDVLKMVDEITILGRAFFGRPNLGRELCLGIIHLGL